MPRSRDGHINAGIVDRSPRLRRIVDLLKSADHPLSSQEIAQQAYDFSLSRKVMLNVSTNIGEIRAPANRELGYVISEAMSWKSDRYPWHDGRPRYFLIAAPGWVPRWSVDADGTLFYPGKPQASLPGIAEEKPAGPRRCMQCGKELGIDGPPWCREECKAGFFGRK